MQSDHAEALRGKGLIRHVAFIKVLVTGRSRGINLDFLRTILIYTEIANYSQLKVRLCSLGGIFFKVFARRH